MKGKQTIRVRLELKPNAKEATDTGALVSDAATTMELLRLCIGIRRRRCPHPLERRTAQVWAAMERATVPQLGVKSYLIALLGRSVREIDTLPLTTCIDIAMISLGWLAERPPLPIDDVPVLRHFADDPGTVKGGKKAPCERGTRRIGVGRQARAQTVGQGGQIAGGAREVVGTDGHRQNVTAMFARVMSDAKG